MQKEFVLRHQGKVYSVIPLALIWNHDYYYLVARSSQSDEIKHYRVDRMKGLTISEDRFAASEFNIAKHIQQSFNMYPGKEEYVEIQFCNQLVNVVIDRFGTDVLIRKVDADTFSIKIKAAVSDGLLRWLLTWGSDAKVISPSSLVSRMKEEAEKMSQLYT